MSVDELAKPWIVVRNGQIIDATDSRRCAYAVARDVGAQVYYCDGVRDCLAHLALMADYDPEDDVLYQLDDVANDRVLEAEMAQDAVREVE